MRIAFSTFILFLIQFLSLHGYASNKDSLFISDCKTYAFKEIGVSLKGDFYTKMDSDEKPYIYLYVSLSDTIDRPEGFNNFYFSSGSDEEWAVKKSAEFKTKGYQVFCYKTYANSATQLNKRLLSYPDEAKAFIVFHELTHNYLTQYNAGIPYEFNESLCDIIGNYGALKYAETVSKADRNRAKDQIRSNENIYRCINKYTSRINSKPAKGKAYAERCYKKIQKILKACNQLQTDRFNYEVNNAYLLRYKYYCKNYFLLKTMLQKEKTISNLLEAMKRAPSEIEN